MKIKTHNQSDNVLLFDMHYLMYRNLFVARSQMPDDTDFKFWKHLLLQNILATIKMLNGSEVVFVIDSKKSWRKDYYKEYKAGRKDSRTKSDIDFDKFFEVADRFLWELQRLLPNMRFLKVDGCEGDDIIAVMCKTIYKGTNIVIISGDLDMVQLLSENVKMYDLNKEKYIEVKNPKQELLIKILTGCKSDNIPQLKDRLGPKTAAKIVTDNAEFDKFINSPDINSKYKLNRLLIDFGCIPIDIQKDIINAYGQYELKEFNEDKMLRYLKAVKMQKILDNIGRYLSVLREVRI